MKRAVYYHGGLMLIPEEFDSFEQFVDDVITHPMQVLVCLNEKECLAPYFIEEYCEIKAVYIQHPDQLIEVQVEVMKQKEYEMRLSQIRQQMKLNHSLDSLRMSLTLDGTFLREKHEACYVEMIQKFWYSFQTKEKYLRQAMDNQCEQNDELRMMLHLCCGIPYSQLRVYVRKIKKKHVVMMSTLADSLYQILLDGILHHAPKKYKKLWDFYSYLPKQMFQYVPVYEDYDVREYPFSLRVTSTEFDHLRYDVEFEIQPYHNFAAACEENYLYMCSLLGENMFHAVVHSFKWTQTTKRTGISCQKFHEQLMSGFDPKLIIQLAGHMHQIGLRLHEQKEFSERGFEQHIMTRCVECTDWFVLDKPSVDINGLQLDMNIGFSTLVFHLRDDEEHELQHKHILLDLMKFLVENTSMEIIDYCISKDRIDVDFMNFDSAKMFNTLRNNAPVFEKYDCRYDEHTIEGTNHYEISYRMKRKTLSFNQLN